jgi:hypothetical protein
MNSLILIDALCKKSKPRSLKSVQNPNLVHFLSDPVIDYDTAATWRPTLEEHRLLTAR